MKTSSYSKYDKYNTCISMEDINKSFDGKKVLKEVSLEVPCGAVYGLLGPSGCGKTTTVKILAGISDADSDSGETVVLGGRMPDLNLMKKIGYMAQSDALYSTLTGRENLEFFGMLYGLKGEKLKLRINEVLNLLNLSDDTDKLVSAYSGGMKRRLSLAAAILHSPDVLILDEPTVGIDPLLRQVIWDEFYELANSGITILVTTHVMDEAQKCSNLAMMRAGRIIATGTPDELYERTGFSDLEKVFLKYAEEEILEYDATEQDKEAGDDCED